jgi:hypothetical protein
MTRIARFRGTIPMFDLVDLAPGQTILYHTAAGTTDDQARFLDILRKTWRLVPSDQCNAIYVHYQDLHKAQPIVRFKLLDGAAKAGEPTDNFMLCVDSSTILNWPEGEEDTKLVIAHELAHGLMYATSDKTHTTPPPNHDKTSPEYLAWDNAREAAANKVLSDWSFVDPIRLEKLNAAVLAYAEARRKAQTRSRNP